MYLCIGMYVYVCVYICVYMYVYVCMYTYMYECISVCVCVYMFVRTCTRVEVILYTLHECSTYMYTHCVKKFPASFDAETLININYFNIYQHHKWIFTVYSMTGESDYPTSSHLVLGYLNSCGKKSWILVRFLVDSIVHVPRITVHV